MTTPVQTVGSPAPNTATRSPFAGAACAAVSTNRGATTYPEPGPAIAGAPGGLHRHHTPGVHHKLRIG